MSTIDNIEKKDDGILALPICQPIEVECMEEVLDVISDFEEYLDQEYANSSLYMHSENKMSKEERLAYAKWWENFLKDVSAHSDDYYDDEYDDYYNDAPSYDYLDDDYDDLPFDEQIFPPIEKKKGHFKPQRFINGVEVDNDGYGALYERRSKKHKHRNRNKVKKHKTKQYVEDNKTDYNVDGADEEKKIVLYRTLADENDTYEWDSVYEFNEWLQENNIYVKDSDVIYILNNDEVHCCLDPTTSDKILVTARSYGDLIWDLTGADADLIKEYSQKHWNI